MKKLILLSILILCAIIVPWLMHKGKNTKKSSIPIVAAAKSDTLVPTPYDIHHEFTTVGERKWKDQMEAIKTYNEAFEYLLQARHVPEVNTVHDAPIWKLIEQYAAKKKPYRYALVPLDRDSTLYAALYDGRTDMYHIGNNYLTLAEMSLVMYHELRHEVDRIEAVASGVDPEDNKYWASAMCAIEERGYAAGVRMMLAFKRLGILPQGITGDPRRENFMQMTLKVWVAIADHRFCEWLKGLYRYFQENPTPPE